ncbi:hypothetical protein [Roseomonas genomospecies 6]|uniref:Uncharacterized protein n=1 Tax=Roseomonas genomospecies 6 TaxID=214106 RepID=A0A9W7NFG3_9PROT|nr:hypothetical protein [Roseomonas genomospecies 6]KAA0676412.1 hypothetical protein DS843_27185 [Roseomonas genomospecies 6]
MAEGYCKIEQYADETTAKSRRTTLASLGYTAMVAAGNVFLYEKPAAAGAGDPPDGKMTRRTGNWFVIAIGTSDTLK